MFLGRRVGEEKGGRKKREGTRHIASACVQLWPNKVIGGFHSRRAGTTLLGDDFGPTPDASGVIGLLLLRTNEGSLHGDRPSRIWCHGMFRG